MRPFGSYARGDHVDGPMSTRSGTSTPVSGCCKAARLVAALEAPLDAHVDVVGAGALRP